MIKRYMHNLSHDFKFDADFGKLYPILLEEIMPGDTFRVFTDLMVRAMPMVSPAYHDIDVIVRYFFVPNRLIWSEWEDFITGGSDGTHAPVAPHFENYQIVSGELYDYFGAPIQGAPGIDWISALPARAYAKIINDWFIDQTLDTPLTFSVASGADISTNGSLFYVRWEKDYFTACLPNAQRGNAVTLGIGTSAPVTIPGNVDPNASQLGVTITDQSGGPFGNLPAAGGGGGAVTNPSTNNSNVSLRGDVAGGSHQLIGTADLTSATAVTINQLRLAEKIQRVLELLARTGARYIEYILAAFGVRSQDARLQRAEYLGGGKSKLIVSEVLQTSETNTTPQGNMAGHGFSLLRANQFKKSFTEHGYIMGLFYILPKTSYQQGLDRRFSRTSRWDYFIPMLQNIGEQAVLKKELYYDLGDGLNDNVFGYIGRWDELRRRENRFAGNFRNVGAGDLGNWCLTRVFAARPALNSTFLSTDGASKRIFASPNDPGFAVMLRNNIKAIRPICKVNKPSMM